MKNPKYLLTAILFILFLVTLHSVNAQNKFDFSIGSSSPALANIEGRWHYNDLYRLDFLAGTDFGIYSDGNTLVLGFNHAIYFGNINDEIGRKTWTINTASVYTYTNRATKIEKKYWLNVYFAKEIVLSHSLLLEPELGIAIDLYTDIKRKKDYQPEGAKILPFYPKFGLNLIFCLN